MTALFHHRLDPASRQLRLMLAEYDISVELVETSAWTRQQALTEIDPAAILPVLVDESSPPVIGPSATLHFVETVYAPDNVEGLIPSSPTAQAEMWRLMDWISTKFSNEVSQYILEEKIGRRERRSGTPDPTVLRAAKANLAEHLAYFSYLFATRRWIGGDEMTLADLALAAHLSVLDYLGDIDWNMAGETRAWYARIKSRPSFRTLLADKMPGMPAAPHYADLDF